MAQHAGDALLALIKIDDVVGRNAAGIEALLKQSQRRRIEPPALEHGGRPRQYFLTARADRLRVEAVARHSSHVVNARFRARAAVEPFVENQREPQQEIIVIIGERSTHVERLELETQVLVRVNLDRKSLRL